MTKRVLLVAAALAVVLILGPGTYLTVWPNRMVVRNSGAVPLSTVSLTVQNLAGTWSCTWNAALLLPGQSFVIRHGQNDTRATLRFNCGGMTHEFAEPYIDLWRGESWILDIRPDSSVVSRREIGRSGA